MNKYLNSQLNGPVVQAVVDSIEQENELYNRQALDYFAGLSLETAEVQRNGVNIDFNIYNDLLSISEWVGLPWPYVAQGIFDELPFIFGTISNFSRKDWPDGFANQAKTQGGFFTGAIVASPSGGTRMPIDSLKKLLRWTAFLKVNGTSLVNIDIVLNQFARTYTITFEQNGDIVIKILNPVLSADNFYVLNLLFNLFSIAPRISITN